MDIFFPDPNDPPLPPEEVRLRDLRAEPWPDGRHTKILLELTPFQKRPSVEIFLIGPGDLEAARTSILETLSHKLELNLHLKPGSPAGIYALHVTVYYQPLPAAKQPLPAAEQPLPAAEQPGATLLEPLVVDRAQISFTISPQ